MENHGKAIDELVRGRQFANQLRKIINGDDTSSTTTPLTLHLVNNVIRSFANTLFLFDKYPTYESHEGSENHQRDTPFVKPEESLPCYISSTAKGKRGCYKRRNTTQTWEQVSENPTDEHQWRKYGQKTILNAKYTRNYFRCTHNVDQKCQATKQVQRIQEEPPLYRNIYFGHHTCKSLLKTEILLDPNSPPRTSIFISFDKTFPAPTKQDCPFLSSCFPSPSVNNECKEELPSSSTLDDSSMHVTPLVLKSDGRGMMSGALYNDSIELDDFLQPLLDLDDQMGMFWASN